VKIYSYVGLHGVPSSLVVCVPRARIRKVRPFSSHLSIAEAQRRGVEGPAFQSFPPRNAPCPILSPFSWRKGGTPNQLIELLLQLRHRRLGGAERRRQHLFRLGPHAKICVCLGEDYAPIGTDYISGGKGHPPTLVAVYKWNVDQN